MVLEHGAMAGYPLQDVRVIVYDGKYHPVDSKEVAFVTAGKKAFMDAITKARPLILEPIVNLDVTVPDAHMGDITGGLSAKRGRINGTDSARGGEIVIKAQVPLAEIGGLPERAEGDHRRARAVRDRVHPLRGGAARRCRSSWSRLRPRKEEESEHCVKAESARTAMRLEDIPNIGPSIADDLRALDIFEPHATGRERIPTRSTGE